MSRIDRSKREIEGPNTFHRSRNPNVAQSRITIATREARANETVKRDRRRRRSAAQKPANTFIPQIIERRIGQSEKYATIFPVDWIEFIYASFPICIMRKSQTPTEQRRSIIMPRRGRCHGRYDDCMGRKKVTPLQVVSNFSQYFVVLVACLFEQYIALLIYSHKFSYIHLLSGEFSDNKKPPSYEGSVEIIWWVILDSNQ